MAQPHDQQAQVLSPKEILALIHDTVRLFDFRQPNASVPDDVERSTQQAHERLATWRAPWRDQIEAKDARYEAIRRLFAARKAAMFNKTGGTLDFDLWFNSHKDQLELTVDGRVPMWADGKPLRWFGLAAQEIFYRPDTPDLPLVCAELESDSGYWRVDIEHLPDYLTVAFTEKARRSELLAEAPHEDLAIVLRALRDGMFSFPCPLTLIDKPEWINGYVISTLGQAEKQLWVMPFGGAKKWSSAVHKANQRAIDFALGHSKEGATASRPEIDRSVRRVMRLGGALAWIEEQLAERPEPTPLPEILLLRPSGVKSSIPAEKVAKKAKVAKKIAEAYVGAHLSDLGVTAAAQLQRSTGDRFVFDLEITVPVETRGGTRARWHTSQGPRLASRLVTVSGVVVDLTGIQPKVVKLIHNFLKEKSVRGGTWRYPFVAKAVARYITFQPRNVRWGGYTKTPASGFWSPSFPIRVVLSDEEHAELTAAYRQIPGSGHTGVGEVGPARAPACPHPTRDSLQGTSGKVAH